MRGAGGRRGGGKACFQRDGLFTKDRVIHQLKRMSTNEFGDPRPEALWYAALFFFSFFFVSFLIFVFLVFLFFFLLCLPLLFSQASLIVFLLFPYLFSLFLKSPFKAFFPSEIFFTENIIQCLKKPTFPYQYCYSYLST